MARVPPRNTNTTVRQPTTGATTNTNATTATGNVTPAADTTPTDAMDNTGPSAAGGATPTIPKAEINGLQNLTTNYDDFATTRGSGSFNVGGGGGQPGAVDRGYIKCDADPVAGGCRLTVDSYHSTPNDKITLVLMAEVLDTKTNELRTINLSVLGNQMNMNGDGFRGQAQFDIKYDDVNKYLKQYNPKLQLNPGNTSLSVMAFFNDDNGRVQHRAGGPARGGRFRIPQAPGTMSPIATRIGGATPAGGDDTPLPLDMQVAYPNALTDSYSMLKKDGNIVSRLESEFKGSTTKQEMVGAIHSMYDMVEKIKGGDHSEVEKLLGKDWTIETVSRYWIKDDGNNDDVGKAGTGFFKGFRVDDDGLPVQDPMRDSYMDNKRLGMTSHEGAIRLRSNKQATQINVKPGGGRLDDKTGIKQRIEVGLELKPDATEDDVKTFLSGVSSSSTWTDTIFNHAERQVKKLDDGIKLAETLEPWLDVVQDRHKFTVKNEKTGVEIEFSFDIVTATTKRPEHADENGQPRTVKFYVLEGELDHLQLQSANQGNYAAGDADGGAFKTDDAQEKWLKKTSGEVTMDIDPRLHELDDLENDAFRQTDSYRAFEGVNDKLKTAIFPNGFQPAKQKAAHAAEMLGLVPLTREAVNNKIRYAVQAAGLKWTPELKASLEKLADSDQRMAKVDDLFYDPNRQNDVIDMLERIYGISLPPLEYDRDNVIMMVEDAIRPLGLEVSPEVADLLGSLTVDKVSPEWLKQQLNGLEYQDDATVFTNIAARQGVPVAKPTVNVYGLEKRVDDVFKQAWIDDSCKQPFMDYLAEAAKGGASAYKLRDAIGDMSWRPEDSFKVFEKFTDVAKPKLEVDHDRYLASATQGLKSQHVVMTDELKDFLMKAATDHHKTVRSARDFAEGLDYGDFGGTFESVAKALNISPPKLTYDLKKLDKELEKYTDSAQLKFDDKVSDFAHALLDSGVSSYKLKRAFSRLSRGDLEAGLKSEGIKVPDGLSVPKMKYDLAKVDALLKESSAQAFIVFDQPMESFTHKLLKEVDGMTPSKLTSFIADLSARSMDDALKNQRIDVPQGVTAPAVNYNERALIKNIEGRAGGGWNDEVGTYLRKNLPAALATDDVSVRDLARGSLTTVLDKVKKATNVDPPAVG
jgi:hypothetical protein